jgi:hypothetical protein
MHALSRSFCFICCTFNTPSMYSICFPSSSFESFAFTTPHITIIDVARPTSSFIHSDSQSPTPPPPGRTPPRRSSVCRQSRTPGGSGRTTRCDTGHRAFGSWWRTGLGRDSPIYLCSEEDEAVAAAEMETEKMEGEDQEGMSRKSA